MAAAEERWNTVRDSLRTLSEAHAADDGAGPARHAAVSQAFEQFGRLEGQEERGQAADGPGLRQRFDQLQRRRSRRRTRSAWSASSGRSGPSPTTTRWSRPGCRRRAARRSPTPPTPNGDRGASASPEGKWWVYARYTLPYEELYWNLPVEVTRRQHERRAHRGERAAAAGAVREATARSRAARAGAQPGAGPASLCSLAPVRRRSPRDGSCRAAASAAPAGSAPGWCRTPSAAAAPRSTGSRG